MKVLWNTATERNPEYPEGKDDSRYGFTYNPYYHPKGRFFQNIIKKNILRAIDMIHYALVTKYEKHIFIYDDPRLRMLNDFLRSYINIFFQDSKPYKEKFMNKIVDIVLGLAKEDVYYRARLFDAFNKMRELDAIELTDIEKKNLKYKETKI